MFKGKFGTLPKKKVAYAGGVLTIGKEEVDLDSVIAIYKFDPRFTENGHISFSYDGEYPKVSDKTWFYYTKGQAKKVYELIDVLNIDVDVLESHSMVKQASKEAKEGFQEVNKIRNRIACPVCNSTNLQFLGNKKKGFSIGKAVGGGLLTGGVGTLAGFAGKNGKKDQWHCVECGNVFKAKARR